MRKTNRNIRFTLWALMLTAPWLSSCGEKKGGLDVRPESQVPVSFGADIAEVTETTTRADQPLAQGFKVYGYKTLPDTDHSNVFPGYTVSYTDYSAGSSEDNIYGYSYSNMTGQFIKYWDYSATEYRFWGYVDNGKVSASNDGTELTISGLSVGIDEPSNYLISALKPVSEEDFGKVVQLRFRHPYAKVRVMIYSGEKLAAPQGSSSGDNIELSEIAFGPVGTSPQIMTAATINVKYPLTGSDPESYTISNPHSDRTAFRYKGFDAPAQGSGTVLKLTSANCTSNTAAIAYPVEATESNKDKHTYYYVLPTGTGGTTSDYQLTVNVDGDNDTKTAIVPSIYMYWNPNYQYTYIFKILESGLLFVDAKVEEWQNGGNGSDTWVNW